MLVQAEKIPFRNGGCGRLTLRRSPALNALNQEMLRQMREALERWEFDPEVSLIWLEAESEKAFCAGGDVKAVVEHARSGDLGFGEDFFLTEYGVDYLLHCYPKPVVCWAHGITMGGGMGLLAGASHRVVTETSVLAMPEISIGFFPDVGGGYFLNQLPKGVGLFLALTGTRLRGNDAVSLGLADALVQQADKARVFEALASAPWSSNLSENLHKVSKTLRDFQLREIQSTLVEPLLQIGKGIRGLASFSLLLDYLKDQIFDSSILEEGRAQFFRGSPLAAQVIFEHQKRCVNKSLQEVFELEWSLALSFCREPDFLEGVRSLLIDKDKSPGWRFAWSSEIPPQEWQKLLAPQEPHLLRPELLRRQPRASVKS